MTAEEYDAATRQSFWLFIKRVFAELNPGVPYSDNYHIHIIIEDLEELRLGDERRLAIAMPPRSLKSIIASVAWPAWLLGHNPGLKIICVSYGQELADKMASDCRQVMQSEWYRVLFRKTVLAPKRQALAAFETTAGGGRFSTSVGGVLTGFGGDYIVVDDPMKPDEALSDADRRRANDWVQHSLFTRLNDKAEGRIIIVMQRLHEDDVIGRVSELLTSHRGFKLLAFPAIAQDDETHVFDGPFGPRTILRAAGSALHPDREPLEVLAEIRTMLGNRHFSAQYLQMPAPPEGNIINPGWLSTYTELPTDLDYKLQSWDTASKDTVGADYSVCVTIGVKDGRVYLLDVFRKKMEYPALKRAVYDQAMIHRPAIIVIEDSAAGMALIQELRAENLPGLRAEKPIKDKVVRIERHSARLETGHMLIPADAPWLAEYLHEIAMFPNGRHDDQVDATAQALAQVWPLNGPDAFFAKIRADRAAEANAAIPSIQINHEDHGRRFTLINGREAVREPDGSFLVTLEEFGPLSQVSGIYRV